MKDESAEFSFEIGLHVQSSRRSIFACSVRGWEPSRPASTTALACDAPSTMERTALSTCRARDARSWPDFHSTLAV